MRGPRPLTVMEKGALEHLQRLKDARGRLYDAGYWPVPPLENSIDLWSNGEHVCGYTSNDNPEELKAKIKTLMTHEQYVERRKAIVNKAIKESLRAKGK